jgi:hypothetical protein
MSNASKDFAGQFLKEVQVLHSKKRVTYRLLHQQKLTLQPLQNEEICLNTMRPETPETPVQSKLCTNP